MKVVLGSLLFLSFALITPCAPLAVVCSLDQPVVSPQQTVTATVYVDALDTGSLHYTWKATAGLIKHSDKATAEWSPHGAAPGSYTLSVTVRDTAESKGECSAKAIVVSAERSAPAPTAGFTRETRSALLLKGRKEAANFGLYSYMLLGSPPNPANADRYRKFLESFLNSVLVYEPLSQTFSPAQLNIAYLPVASEVPAHYDVEWILDNYDYDRARFLLDSIPGVHGDGPFIVSSDHPLAGPGHPPNRCLFEDLTTVPPSIVEFWVKQFRSQTAQERWDSATLGSVALRLRTVIEIAAIGLPEVRKSVTALITVK